MSKAFKVKEVSFPTTKELEKELAREQYKTRYRKIFMNTVSTLIIVVAMSILITNLLFPVLQISGKSMRPTLTEGDIVVAVKGTKIERGDVIGFYYNNRILVKRVIATSSEWVNIDNDGNIYINDKLLEEKYIDNKSLGEVDIEFPYLVPEESYFVLGDDRVNSRDSRSSLIGAIPKEDIIGEIKFRVWPIKGIGIVN